MHQGMGNKGGDDSEDIDADVDFGGAGGAAKGGAD